MKLDTWYAAQTLPGLEATAIYNLTRVEIDACAPSAADKRARLFPGYAFVRLTDERDCFEVNRTRGIIKLLPVFSNVPRALPDGFVEELMARVVRGEFDERAQEDLLYRFVPGESVVALTGLMRDRCGKFLRHQKGSGVVLGYLLGKEFEYIVPLHQLTRAGVTPPESRSASKVLRAA